MSDNLLYALGQADANEYLCSEDLRPSENRFLANLNLCLRSLYAVERPSLCPSVVCLSVTPVHPTHAVVIFGNISTEFGTLAIRWHRQKIYADRPRGTPPSGELNTTGVAKYSDFGPIDGYISETMQDRR